MIYLIAGLIISLLILLFSQILLWKLNNAYKNHMEIMNAISKFYTDNPELLEPTQNIEETMFGRIEDLEKTIWRLWDWDCKNILPLADYILIKGYLKEEK